MGGGVHLFGSYPSRVHTVIRLRSEPVAALKVGPDALFSPQASIEFCEPPAQPAAAPQHPSGQAAPRDPHQQPGEGRKQDQNGDGGIHIVGGQLPSASTASTSARMRKSKAAMSGIPRTDPHGTRRWRRGGVAGDVTNLAVCRLIDEDVGGESRAKLFQCPTTQR